MKKETWYLAPKVEKKEEDVPFVVGGLYRLKDYTSQAYILAEVEDAKYQLICLNNGIPYGPITSRSSTEVDLNEDFILLSEKIQIQES